MGAQTAAVSEELTARQREVLDAVLALLVDVGGQVSMAAVARRARCSKETLYKWFGDREGVLTATVRWQASGVRAPNANLARLDRKTLADALELFGRDLLTVLTGPTSVALNRVAIGAAAGDLAGLGAIVLANGRKATGQRLIPLLEAARDAGLLAFESGEDAYQLFFGLVVRDVQIRLLLGERIAMSAAQIGADAALAKDRFLALCGA